MSALQSWLSAWKPIGASLWRFDHRAIHWLQVLRGALITALLLVVALSLGQPRAVIPLSTGAVFVSIVETGPGQGHPWRSCLWTTLGLSLSSGVAALCSSHLLWAVLSSAVMALLCAMAAHLGPRTGVRALLFLVLYTVVVGFPMAVPDVQRLMLGVLIGGGAQTIGCLLMTPLERIAAPTASPPMARHWRHHWNHGLRLALALAIATLISESTGLRHQYWLPMSVVWMSRVDLSITVERVLHRVLGTILGLLVVLLADLLVAWQNLQLLPLAMLGVVIAMATIWVHYAVAVTGITIWVMTLFLWLGDPVTATILTRLGATLLAALILLMVRRPERLA